MATREFSDTLRCGAVGCGGDKGQRSNKPDTATGAAHGCHINRLMAQSGLVWSRSSPRARRRARGWTSSAVERCSSGTARSRTERRETMVLQRCWLIPRIVIFAGKGPTLSSLKAVIQHVLLCSSSAHSIFSSLQSLLALLGCPTTHGNFHCHRSTRWADFDIFVRIETVVLAAILLLPPPVTRMSRQPLSSMQPLQIN